MRKKKTKKIKLKNIFIFLGIISLFVIVLLWYKTLHITNIYVLGNSLLTEQEIIELANLEDYPKVYQILKSDIEKKLLTSDLVKKVHVSKTLLGKITIEIDESRLLLRLSNGKYLTDENKEIEYPKDLLGIPLLMNDCSEIQDNLIKKMALIKKDILEHISEVEYKKTDLDNERFLFYMNDGNYVYITLNKIELINSYNEIYPTLEGKKGILYLDSGNHFEIKK